MLDDKGNFSVNKLGVVNEYRTVSHLNLLPLSLNLILIYLEGKDSLDGVAPEVTTVNSPVEVLEGSTAKLTCVVTGTPYPKVTWLIDGSPVETSERVIFDCDGEFSSLLFLSTELDDEGEYQCKAQNEIGSAISTMELLVNELSDLEDQSKPEFSEKLKEVSTFEGDTAVFSVKVQGFPLPDVQWYSSEREILKNERFVTDSAVDGRHTLTINDCVTKDKGRYKCVASNVVGKAVCSAGLTVKEKLIPPQFSDQDSGAPMLIDEGSDVMLQVEVTGKPKPSTKWYKDDQPISRTSSKYKTDVLGERQSLNIVAATPEDSGIYQCRATSPSGTITRTFDVNIKG